MQACQHWLAQGGGPLLGGSLVQVLLAELVCTEEQPPVPPCPTFLYSPVPCFPWAPGVQDAVAAAAAAAAAAAEAQAAAVGVPPASPPARQPGTPPDVPGDRGRAEQEHDADHQATKRQRTEQPAAAAAAGRAGAAAAPGPTADVGGATTILQTALLRGALPSQLPAEVMTALETVLTLAATGSPWALEQAGLGCLPDEALLRVVAEAVGPSSSFARCSALARGMVLPKLLALEAAPSRDLAAVLEHLGELGEVGGDCVGERLAQDVATPVIGKTWGQDRQHPSPAQWLCCSIGCSCGPSAGSTNPKALIAACMQPLLAAPQFGRQHGEMVGRLIKEVLPGQLLPDLLAAACSPAEGSTPGSTWTEAMVGVLQTIANGKPALGPAVLRPLAEAVQGAGSGELRASVKWGKLLLSLVKQYGGQLAPHKAQLLAAAEASTSFMTKPLLAALAKL